MVEKQDNTFVVDEETFNNAVNNAGSYARRRLFRKMTKTRFRVGGFDRILPDTKEARDLRTGKAWLTGGKNTERTPLPPHDLEEYVERFVRYFYKEPKNENPSN